MTEAEAVSLKEAARRVRLSVDTIRRLNAKHGIGRQMGPRSPIEVSMPAVVMLRHGDLEALELLRLGRRQEPAVRRYLELAGSVQG
ncbi:hypothetical protein [Aureimonas leprariae]|uniref:Helix-turn-helix domain-containing protein n=1 Tax=Plantimonas leprariae TaxID=2615207 RepID=A0A7V7PKC9_9HYPH|nr:hypothetical protein [Aureimonas leprariae]KAB0676007.1 hypothetical protein F6X38_22355 [Aureimonas leprariae]